MKRGDVVIVGFPFATGNAAKRRPALVVQNDRDNARITHTIIAMITGNLKRKHESTHCLVDPSTPAGASSGLSRPSLVNCSVLYTIERTDIVTTIGSFDAKAMLQFGGCLRSALGL